MGHRNELPDRFVELVRDAVGQSIRVVEHARAAVVGSNAVVERSIASVDRARVRARREPRVVLFIDDASTLSASRQMKVGRSRLWIVNTFGVNGLA